MGPLGAAAAVQRACRALALCGVGMGVWGVHEGRGCTLTDVLGIGPKFCSKYVWNVSPGDTFITRPSEG